MHSVYDGRGCPQMCNREGGGKHDSVAQLALEASWRELGACDGEQRGKKRADKASERAARSRRFVRPWKAPADALMPVLVQN